MPRKPAIAKETAASAKPARATKPSAPRVKAAKHSKVVPVAEKIEESLVAAAPAVTPVAAPVEKPAEKPVEKMEQPVVTASENAHEAIAKIAYGYWESRGFQGGTEIEDWVRAEHEYRQRSAVTERHATASA
jgi:hypothetical protein